MVDIAYLRTVAAHLLDLDSASKEGRAIQDAAGEIERVQSAMAAAVDMIENCADAPTNPDSLLQMVKQCLASNISPNCERKSDANDAS